MKAIFKLLNEEELNYIISEHDLYLKSLYLVQILYVNNKEKLDKIYKVSNDMNTIKGKIVALLYKINNTGISYEELKLLGFSSDIIEILKLTEKEIIMTDINKESNLIALDIKYKNIKEYYNDKKLKKVRDKNDRY